jgi:hypothetical protein
MANEGHLREAYPMGASHRGRLRRENDIDGVCNLERQSAQVDAEIEQRVYVPYGLTPRGDEVKIVEGDKSWQTRNS